jgi:glyoxylase-like metal-dependent hydrolase (beta-lactamase superfamily II)
VFHISGLSGSGGSGKMAFATRADNVYVIDTMMFGFEHYQSSYIIAGEKIALIDTGIPSQLDTVRKNIQKQGFSIGDIACIFLTHCEHPDHAGNVGAFIKENPGIKVYINPSGLEYLTDPSIENENRKKVMLPQMAARFGEQLLVPPASINFLQDGQVFDLGGGEKLRFMFTPGHQPSGLVIFEEKNQGLFINDLVGNYFADIDFSLVLTPPRSDVFKARESLLKFMQMPIKRLYMGHYGISHEPRKVMERTLAGIQKIMDIAEQCVKEGKPEKIEHRVLASKMSEVEKLKKRSLSLFEYTRDELITHHSKYFAEYYLEKMKSE